MRNYATQMDAARKGIITPEMEAVAKKEYRTPEEIRDLVARGQVAICANRLHTCLRPNGVGSMLRTKINVNLGVSQDCKDYETEMRKVMAAVEMGAEAIGVILRKLCQQKGIEIVEAEACPDHIHMLASIPPKYSVSQIMGYLKGKSSLMIFDRHANLKYKYGNRHFWARGYYVDTVGRNKKQVAEYIRNQLQADQMADQIGLKEFVDPFTGRENKKA